ncbi:MAG: transcription-repair coupling factor [Alphaproteobacteria bacterium]|nr:transcription-repair coupling factor [Alphaproteobacteria bacterium]
MFLAPASSGRLRIAGAPEGLDALALAAIARGRPGGALHLAAGDIQLAAMAQALAFFAPDVDVVTFPGWDCMPYDRVSPSSVVLSQRMAALSRLAATAAHDGRVLLTTVAAAAQRLPPRATVTAASFQARPGGKLDVAAFSGYLVRDGYNRVGTAREAGEYAVRGGILDVFPPGREEPLRLDLFGDTLESIRTFDPLTQRTTGNATELVLQPVSEILLDAVSIARFRAGYAARFGAVGDEDPLYESISAGHRHPGAEHWLPLFHERLETVFDYVPGAAVTLDFRAEEARAARGQSVAENYQARKSAWEGEGAVYRPLAPEALYLTDGDWAATLEGRSVGAFTPLRGGDGAAGSAGEIDLGGHLGRDFATERTVAGPSATGGIVLDAVRDYIAEQRKRARRVLVAAISAGARDRLGSLLHDHGVDDLSAVTTWHQAEELPPSTIGLAILGLEHGFETDQFAVLAEPDLLGERISRAPRRSRKAEDFIRELSSLSPGDVIVHVDHGIGRFMGLEKLTIQDRPHDCVALVYDGGDKLYIPVENIDVISRYCGDAAEVVLDKLGGQAWQARKARAKQRITEMAGQLMKIAAQRHLKEAPKLTVPPGLYEEFASRFPYQETEDQDRSIREVLSDLASGRPMGRLVCGDVGFGKTEVALRSAFVAAMAGKQVALVAPTTLLVRQHVKLFKKRFADWPLRIEQLSRLTKPAEAAEVKRGLANGDVDVVIGTHALLAKGIEFKDLGLLVIDEEQRFGVTHKERLKELRSDVHVLTLTATPIPRTLQMAMAGIRELSLIATPPVDRLAVRTFILPFDAVVVREAIQRERNRGGQVFYVCPRISDLDQVSEFVRSHVKDAKIAVAHGRLSPTELEKVMVDFYDGAANVLIATNIIESGLDIPTANTLVIHRADMFGLAELYQLRGRIGRSKVQGYAYLTIPETRTPTETAERRLKVMQSLDQLGAGFSLASHDLDIRGAGNLLGAEQSGHIREVGFELYQRMLEEAVAAARADAAGTAAPAEQTWSPQIDVGAAVLIPESYVTDLDVRLALYRRIAELKTDAEAEAFAAEMIDRFGPLPEEAEQLLKIVAIKRALRLASVARLTAGPKGATLSFRDTFPNPAGLIEFIESRRGQAKLRPDQTMVVLADWSFERDRLDGVRWLADRLAQIATTPQGAPPGPGPKEPASMAFRPPPPPKPQRPFRPGTQWRPRTPAR